MSELATKTLQTETELSKFSASIPAPAAVTHEILVSHQVHAAPRLARRVLELEAQLAERDTTIQNARGLASQWERESYEEDLSGYGIIEIADLRTAQLTDVLDGRPARPTQEPAA